MRYPPPPPARTCDSSPAAVLVPANACCRISGDGSVTVEDGGSLDIMAFNVSINSYPGYPSNETYIMRDITVNAGGSMLSERLSIVHFG